MSDNDRDEAVEQTSHVGTDPNTPPQDRDEDSRTDIEQAVQSRSDAVDRGEGGPEPEPMTAPGDYSGNAGTGGEVKNQDVDVQ